MLLTCQPGRRAFTRVELLIVVGMLLVTAGLAVVGVQKCQDQANQITCEGNLMRIGLAVGRYNDANKHAPPVWVPDSGNGTQRSNYTLPTKSKGTIHFLLLPYMGSRPLYESANGDSANIAATIYETYLCPADPSLPGHLNSTGYASTSYAANLVVFHPRDPPRVTGAMQSVGFYGNDFSNTVLFAERYQACQDYEPAWANHPAGPGGRENTPVFGWTDFGKHEELAGAALVTGNPSFYCGMKGFQIAPPIADCDPSITQGSHPRVMNVLMGDGSVRAISRDMSFVEWRAICQPGPAVSDADWIE